MDLRPHRGDDKVAIPVTFDVKSSTLQLKMSRLYVSVALMLGAIILWIVCLAVAATSEIRWIVTLIAWVLVPLICRFAIIEEYKFRKNYRLLREHSFTYDYSLFWSIYDTSAGTPTIFHHTSGTYSIFVAFDKDVIVGKGNDADYDHGEAIANAYQLLAKKDILCTHLDYMDNVGKDTRLQSLFDVTARCKNPELRECVTDMLDYMQWYMSGAYADYDVYCFTSKMRPDLFVDELMPVLSALESGNYIRYRMLDRQDLRDLVASVMGTPDFSVTRSCDGLFSSRGLSSYLRVIYIDVKGKREIVNKTRAQMAEEARIAQEERIAARANRRNRNTLGGPTVDLFDDNAPEPVAPTNLSKSQQFRANAGFAQLNTSNAPQGIAPSVGQSGRLPAQTQGTTGTDEEFDLFGDGN